MKQSLDVKISKPPFVNEGDIWWCAMGENVGSEINGKSELFSRPAILLKKLSNSLYFVVPTTTKNAEGSWYVNFSQKGKSMNACLHQARTIDYRRLFSKLGELDDMDFAKIGSAFHKLYCKKIPLPDKSERGRGKIPNVAKV